MRTRRRNRNEPIDDPIAIVARQAEVLLRRGLADQAAATITRFAVNARQDNAERDQMPMDDWSVLDDHVGLRERLRAILSDTPYTTIGRCRHASDAELLDLELLGPAYLAELRDAIAHVIAIYGDPDDL